MNIGYLVSGNLGLVTLQKISKSLSPAFVITDKNSPSVSELCASQGWKHFVGKPVGGKFLEFKNSISQPDLLVSINFLFLLAPDIIRWPKKAAINIHGALLPKYRGRAPHIWAIINGEKESGITVHIIDQECDTGDILYQETIPIGPKTTGGDLLKTFEERYADVLKYTIEGYLSGKILPKPQDNLTSSYFGKRTPEDGAIDWSWGYTQLNNWVRALTYPYPGAFSFVHGNKIKILEIQQSVENPEDYSSCQLGTIVKKSDTQLFIRGADSIVQISKYEMTPNKDLKVGDILLRSP